MAARRWLMEGKRERGGVAKWPAEVPHHAHRMRWQCECARQEGQQRRRVSGFEWTAERCQQLSSQLVRGGWPTPAQLSPQMDGQRERERERRMVSGWWGDADGEAGRGGSGRGLHNSVACPIEGPT